jgi:hypothetical protein
MLLRLVRADGAGRPRPARRVPDHNLRRAQTRLPRVTPLPARAAGQLPRHRRDQRLHLLRRQQLPQPNLGSPRVYHARGSFWPGAPLRTASPAGAPSACVCSAPGWFSHRTRLFFLLTASTQIAVPPTERVATRTWIPGWPPGCKTRPSPGDRPRPSGRVLANGGLPICRTVRVFESIPARQTTPPPTPTPS